MENKGTSRVEVAIIGAGKSIELNIASLRYNSLADVYFRTGWYGLASARTYLRLRPSTNLIIIDSDNSVGGVWSKDRLYPNLVAQVRHGVCYIPAPQRPRLGYILSNMLESYSITRTRPCRGMAAILTILK